MTLSLNDLRPAPGPADATRRAAALLEEAGCRVEEVKPDWPDPAEAFRILVATERPRRQDSRLRWKILACILDRARKYS